VRIFITLSKSMQRKLVCICTDPLPVYIYRAHAVASFVELLYYKPEDHGFDSR
jgi:hypothetical protein